VPSRARNLTVLTLIIVGATIALVALIHDGRVQKAPPSATLTVPVDGLDPGQADDHLVVVPKAAVDQAAPRLEDDLHTPPPAVPTQQLQAVKQAEAKARATLPALPTAGATAGFAGCRTSFVNNQSSRHGVRPTQMWDHYTVSPNRPGWSDIDAVVALFNRNASQASSNFVLDSEGNCAYIVPIEAKAWTQAAANSFAVSFEIIATGREKHYLEPAGMRKLAAVQKEVSHRTGIPMRRGAVHNCVPTRSGIVEHRDGGLCAGGHVDISPFPVATVIADTIRLAGARPCSRACDLRHRNVATHAALKRQHCPTVPIRGACLTLVRRHRAIHRASRREHVHL
jgi:hypothetical protein